MRVGGYDVTEQIFMDARGVPLTRFSEQDRKEFEVLRASLTQAGWKPEDPNTSALTALVAFMWARCTGRADVLLAVKEAIEGGPATDNSLGNTGPAAGGVLGQIRAIMAERFAGFGERLDALVEEITAVLERVHEARPRGDGEDIEVVQESDRERPALTVEAIAAAVIDALDRRSATVGKEAPAGGQSHAISGRPAKTLSHPAAPVLPTVPPLQGVDHEALAAATAERVARQLKPHVGMHLDLAAAKESLRESFQLTWIWLALAFVLAAYGFGLWVGYRWATGKTASEVLVLTQQLTDTRDANATLSRVCAREADRSSVTK